MRSITKLQLQTESVKPASIIKAHRHAKLKEHILCLTDFGRSFILNTCISYSIIL